MFSVDGTAAAVEQSGFCQDEAAGADADEPDSGLVGRSQIVERRCRHFHAPGKLAPDNYDVVEDYGIGEQSLGGDLDAATRLYGRVARTDDHPPAVNLPAVVSLIGRMTQALDEAREGGKGKAAPVRRPR